jgi:hypothetical protein
MKVWQFNDLINDLKFLGTVLAKVTLIIGAGEC